MQNENFLRPRVLSQCFVPPKALTSKRSGPMLNYEHSLSLCCFILKELIGLLINVKISGTVLLNLCELEQEVHGVCRSGKHYIVCCNCLLIS